MNMGRDVSTTSNQDNDDAPAPQPPRRHRESMDGMMEEYENMEHLDAKAVVESFVLYCMSLCAVIVLYCVIYALYLWTLGPPPPLLY